MSMWITDLPKEGSLPEKRGHGGAHWLQAGHTTDCQQRLALLMSLT